MTEHDIKSDSTVAPRYRLVVDKNSHFMDEESRWIAGEFDSADAAVAKAMAMVDDDLQCFAKPGMTAAALFECYKMFGDDPFVIPLNRAAAVEFSAWDYAERRCAEICASR